MLSKLLYYTIVTITSLVTAVGGSGGKNTAKPTPTPVITSTPKPTATPVPTATSKPTATPVPTATPKPTATPVPTATPKPTATPVPTATPKPTATPVPTVIPADENGKEVTLPDDFDWSTYKNSRYTENLGKAVIVIPVNATEEEKLAAQLVQTALQYLDGPVYNYMPEIITDSVKQGSRGLREISIGNTNRPHGTAKYSSDGSYSIKSYNNGVSILGVGPRGTIDGAVYFAQLCGGYYWLSWEDYMRSNQDCFKYSDSIDYDYERDFVFTDVDLNFPKTAIYTKDAYGRTTVDNVTNRVFSLSFGLNGFMVNTNVRGVPGYQSWYLSKGGNYNGLQPGHVHTLATEYFNEEDYRKHPDWFANPGGTYDPYSTALCLTNPEVYARIEKHVFELLDDPKVYDPNAPMQIISLSMPDGGEACYCKNCRAFRKAHYQKVNIFTDDSELNQNSALYLDICNRICKAVKARAKEKGVSYDNVYIDTLAYSINRKPTNIELDDHMIIRFAPIERCYAHTLCDYSTDECMRNYDLGTALEGWAALVKKYNAQLWIWEYTYNFRDSFTAYPNIYSLIEDIKYYKELGVSGIYLQNTDRNDKLDTEYNDLRVYLLSTLLRDTDANMENEIRFFLSEFYGKEAGKYIREAYDILSEQVKRHNVTSGCTVPIPGNEFYANAYYRDHVMTYDAPTSQMYANNYPVPMAADNRMTDKDIARVDELWNKALTAAAKDTARHQYTVGRTHISWRIVKSTLKVLEFADSKTYLKKNYELYDDMFTKYNTTDFRLINGSTKRIPSRNDSVLSKTPENWM